MNRLAVFVEGNTEAIFVEKLIDEIAGHNKVQIDTKEIRGGHITSRTIRLIKASKPTGQQYYVLLYDCGGDAQVKTRIQEEHKNLTKIGYSQIIGIRDVRPDFTYGDIPRLERLLPTYIKTSFAPVMFILSIMEIEAWFLAEASHFPRIEPSITIAAIQARFGFDPENDNMELRPWPSKDLKSCYTLGGKTYKKAKAKITIDALDYALIYLVLRNKINYLDRLISVIEAFLTL